MPIHASDGSTRANTILASLIAAYRSHVQVAQAPRGTRPIESQCSRHRRNPAATPALVRERQNKIQMLYYSARKAKEAPPSATP